MYIFQSLIIILIDVLHIAMFVRAILSWFDPMQEGKLTAFLHTLTEPVIIPVRALLYKLNIGQDTPIDLSFSLTYLILVIVQMFLPIV